MSKKTEIINKVTDWRVVLGLQTLSSLILIGVIFKLGVLPMLYAIILIVVLALLGVGTFFLMKSEKKKDATKRLIGKIVSLVLSVVLLIGSLYIAQGTSVLDSVTDAKTQTTRISVVVKKDNGYSKLSDLKNKTIELNTDVDSDKMEKAVDALKKEESSVKTKENDDFAKMADDLYDGKTDAIYVNEAYYAMLEANHENFQTETEAIWTYEIDEEIEDISKNVDVTNDPFVVYISGIDTYGKVSTISRSDVNMLVTVNPKTKQILLTSIPRDYYVTLANKKAKDKLTHSGLAGIENTVKTVENFMDIDINYYARVNFTSLEKMVDALDGITVDIPTSFYSGVDGSYFKAGTQVLNGKKALKFARERHAFAGGDNARVHNQQVVLMAMLNKMMSPKIITNYTSILKSIDGSFETNMSSKEITDLIQMQINDMASWTFVQKQLDGTGRTMTGGAYMPNAKLYYMLPNTKSVNENKELIQKVLKGEKIEE